TCLKKELGGGSYITNPNMWTCSCPAYLCSRFLLSKHLVQSVRLLNPNFFNEVKHHRSPPFWRHNDLILLTRGLEPVEDDELEKEDEVVDEDELNVQEIDKEFAEALQEYEEGENNMNDNVIVEESNETWEEVNGRVKENLQKWIDLLKSQELYKDTQFLLAAEDAMSGIEKMLKKCETLRNRRTLPKTWKDCDKYTMFYKIA
ncbi:7518_t:CDS:1, partial [Racocetra persica]